jgi:nitrite reductase/ring-hydroxylating ferredoxin subunit
MTSPTKTTRRGLLKGVALTTWAALVGAAALALGAVLRLVGADSGEATPSSLDLGPAADLKPGQVLVKQGVALQRDDKGFFALSLVCPHLGCQPEWEQDQLRFLCPCHGSAFGRDGGLLRGPAERGLSQVHLEKGPAGRLIAYPDRPVPDGQRLSGA